jgi:dihydrofolate synthase / folylpolyglutamate synthase
MISEDLSDVDRAYEEALDYLYGYINLERTTLERYHVSKMSPERPRQILKALGSPQEQYAAVHIAGTKGKGSVAAMCASVLRESGLRVGLYTSPHLRDFRERIRVLTPEDAVGNISKRDFVDGLERVKQILPSFPGVTWFEIVTAVAFAHFADQNVDIAVIEVGLGGRLDATNILQPLVSIITSLSLDHVNLLGDTLVEIAGEKGGIIKQGVPVMVAPQPSDALERLREIAAAQQSPMEVVGEDWRYVGRSHVLTVTRSPHPDYVAEGSRFRVALSGKFQLENAMLAVAGLRPVSEQFSAVTIETIEQGLASVRWDGRLQLVLNQPGAPRLLVDSAHNADSAAKLSEALRSDYEYENLCLIFGAPEDKAIPQMMEELFPLATQVIVAAADHPRAASPELLARQARDLGFSVSEAASPGEALEMAFANAGAGDLICAAGSIIFIGDLLKNWDGLQSELLLPRG